ncbi:MAG: peptidase S14 [Sphingomonadales bacterium]|nr:MAG: peptidase S14 [Sphingomonadales bacterium]
MADAENPVQGIDFDSPQVRLIGELNDASAVKFIETLAAIPEDQVPLVIEVTTTGGDAELGRRLALDIERARKRSGRRMVFVGKSVCYSAGVTIMSAFPVRDRFLTRDCWLLLHRRQLDKTVKLSGPLHESLPLVEALAAEIRVGTQLETEGFERLIAGSDISMHEILEKTPHNWYLSAEDALKRGLVAAII